MNILAKRLGIQVIPPSGRNLLSVNFPRIEGYLMKRAFSLWQYQSGTGDSKRYFTTLNFQVENKYEYTLNVHKERVWSKLGKLTGMQDIEIGDPPFDKSFIVKSNDDYFATEVLKEQQSKDCFKMILSFMDGPFKLNGQILNYRQMGLIRNASNRVFAEHLIETGLVLCKNIEKFAFDRDPTRMEF